jgi:tRNA1Val (adenine37-N6)-methyltransferase
MSKDPFRFKQFEVAQDKSAMKVNTDGVLLGAWADVNEANRILDIGTGTGVIALMMAQKNLKAQIDAIDIDEDHYLQAKENFNNSPWADRLTAYHCDLSMYNPHGHYDLIISNPPYFIDDTHAPDARRNTSRHSIELSYEELMHESDRLIPYDSGTILLVLPVFNVPIISHLGEEYFFYVSHITEVTAVTGKTPYLALMKMERTKSELSKSKIDIQNAEGVFTDEYKALTKDFYLKF